MTENNSLKLSFFKEIKGIPTTLLLLGFLDGIIATSGTILLNDRITSFIDALTISLYMLSLYTILILIGGIIVFTLIFIASIYFIKSIITKKLLKQSVFLIVFLPFILLQLLNKLVFSHAYYSVFPFADKYWKMAIVMWTIVIITAIIAIVLSRLAVIIFLKTIQVFNRISNKTIITSVIILIYFLALIFPILYNKFKTTEKIPSTIKITLADSFLKNRVFLIGLDGATWDIIDPMFKKGELNNLKKLIDNGVRSNIKTSIPTESSILWTSIATGKIPEKHGIKSFTLISFAGVSKQLSKVFQEGIFGRLNYLKFTGLTNVYPINIIYRKTPATWNILSKYGKKVILANWFASYPAEKINGYFISDKFLRSVKYENRLNTPDPCKYYQYLTYPKSLCEDLNSKIDTFISPEIHRKRYVSVFEKYVYEMENINFNIAKDLLNKNGNISFFALYFRGTDDLEHLYWKYIDKEKFPWITESERKKYGNVIFNYYKQVDKYIGDILELSDENTTIILISDHGHEPLFKFFDSDTAGQSGDHTLGPDGIFIASGKNISGKFIKNKPTIYDITPTILYLLGFPIGKDMDGKVLTEIIDKHLLIQNPSKTIETYDSVYDPGDVFKKDNENLLKDEIMMEKLKALGYIN